LRPSAHRVRPIEFLAPRARPKPCRRRVTERAGNWGSQWPRRGILELHRITTEGGAMGGWVRESCSERSPARCTATGHPPPHRSAAAVPHPRETQDGIPEPRSRSEVPRCPARASRGSEIPSRGFQHRRDPVNRPPHCNRSQQMTDSYEEAPVATELPPITADTRPGRGRL
jgi:hypothetical protein